MIAISTPGLVLTCLAMISAVYADSRTKDVKINATITAGCILGSAGSDATSFGSINFGNNISSLFNNIDVTSTQNAGSIMVRCTPKTNVTLGIDSGLNSGGTISTGRLMKLATGTSTLKYQLYQDSNRATIWGNGSNGGQTLTVMSDGSVQKIDIYARLFSSASLPAVGQYSDTVLITVSY
ncbi:spore coat protein U domain-containing protein [Budviciaceae bacterium BWR-B9]|uniref:Spore coat protein U domain-containing protein n=2 Tax=Budviciaceae TaxID=1903416 RepID=A0ABS1IUK0_9GAMM|nr:spore coat protein U domain-containing protein [Limnobaculum allomyrinae]MBV7693136.1 spore coat U domain-containing protein [Limnobaculum sp. M2-1]